MKSICSSLTVCLMLGAAFPKAAPAQITLSGFASRHEIEFASDSARDRFAPGDRLAIYDRTSGKILGYAEVTGPWRARVISHSKNGLVLVGDELKPIDYRQENLHLEGRSDLEISGKRGASSRYKALVYQGPSGGPTAATVSQGEALFGTHLASYGVTENLELSSVWLTSVLGVHNLSAKYKAVENEDFRFSPGVAAYVAPRYSGSAYAANAFLDVRSNSKLISHTTATFFYSTLVGAPLDGSAAQMSYGTSIQSGYEYILDNWNRVMAAPRYNFDTRNIGGYVGYTWIWDRFHFDLGVNTKNLTALKLSYKDGYAPQFSLYWRFD